MTAKKRETPAEAHERGYMAGRRRSLIDRMSALAREYYGEETPPEARMLALEAERLEAIDALRKLCAAHGDNDWTDRLHLRDIIDKHLGRYIGE